MKNVGGLELEIGDPIEYTRNKDGHKKPKSFKGIIASLAGSIITVDLGKYRDSFTIQDLACGAVTIPGMNPIVVTTSEKNEPVREPIEREEKAVRQPIPKPSDEELGNVYNDGDQKIKFVQDFYGISKTTARRWLKEAGLLPDTKPSEAPADDALAAYPIMKHGHIDWDIMWPLVKAELDKGRNRNEVADEFGIGRDAMADKVKRMTKQANPKPVQPAIFVSLSKIQTIADLRAYQAHLAKERELADLILRFVDIALKEKEAEQ